MRYPVDKFIQEWNMTAGYGFGTKTEYGYHDGIDLNKNGGGDVELGVPIYAITKGQLVYYHTTSHPGKNFGYHTVYKITGDWGYRWVHNAHMLPDALLGVQDVKEGQQIGRVGKSGTGYAHDHFAIFKVDPVSLRAGIDTIATNITELNKWWEDPIKFIEKWMGGDSVSNMYRGYDVANQESMKAIVDGYFNRGNEIENANKKIKELESKPTGQTDPKAQEAIDILNRIKKF